MPDSAPRRGEVWFVDLEPVQGHEQGRRRPAVVVSVDEFNMGKSGLVLIVPITSRVRGNPYHVAVSPSEGGLDVLSEVMCEQLRSVSLGRLDRRVGMLAPATMDAVLARVAILLDL